MRIPISIIGLIAASYGACHVLTQTAHTAQTWHYYLTQVCPWALLPGSLIAWQRTYTWRRMSLQKNTAPILSRGHHQASNTNNKTSILEYACQVMFMLAVAAISKQLKIQNTYWFMGGVWGSYFMLRLAIRMVR